MGMNQIVVYNGQSREKNLKLNDKANVLFITSRFSVMHEIDRISTAVVRFCLVVPHGALRDVDPSSEHMYIMGYSFIKDILSVKGGKHGTYSTHLWRRTTIN